MSKVLEEINIKIKAEKEVLETLPKNNPKNIRLYLEKLDEVKEPFEKMQKQAREEMKKRYDSATKLGPNPEIATIEEQLENMEPTLQLLNDNKTSYEKLGFDRKLQNLRYYYNRNLNMVNETISYCLQKFEEVGIKISLEDFCYSKFVKEYLETFFEEMKKGNINSEKILAKFEEIYWKCPDIIVHIELNMRHLYLKHEKETDKYYEKKKAELIHGTTEKEIMEKYIELSKQFIEKIDEDKYEIMESLLNGKINVDDYTEDKVTRLYEKYINAEMLKDMDDNKLDEINANMSKLLHSIYEYKNYSKFEYLVDNIRGIYKEKEKYKNAYEETLKSITEKEKEIIKLAGKIEGKGLFQKPDESQIVHQNNLILETKELYRQLEKNKIYEKIYIDMNDTTSILEILYFISSFYYYLWRSISEKFADITAEEIEKQINELSEFIEWPFCNLLNNVEIIDEKNIRFIIKDRYNLLGINVTKEQFEAENIEVLETEIKKIQTSYYIKKNKIDIKEMKNICEIKKLLEK